MESKLSRHKERGEQAFFHDKPLAGRLLQKSAQKLYTSAIVAQVFQPVPHNLRIRATKGRARSKSWATVYYR
jgi:hypothetical protein